MKATLHTNHGPIVVELFPNEAPKTVANFTGLATGEKEYKDDAGRSNPTPYFDGLIFHRIIPGFMIQGGCPLGRGMGGPGYDFDDEIHPDKQFDRPYILAMANAGPATNGSQFFVTSGTPGHLNMKHTIFGQCDMETVEKISAVELGGPQGSKPLKDVVLEKVTIVREAAAAPAKGAASGTGAAGGATPPTP